MDGGLVSESSSKREYAYELFEKVCPYYLSIGMSYDDFWYGDVNKAVCYREAEQLRIKRYNQEAWLQGMYVYEAICDASPIFNPYAKRGTKPHKYPTEPFPITKEEVAERANKRRMARYEAHKARTFSNNKGK
jgi:hypothetical protein